MICQMLLLKGFTRRWSSTSSANDYDDFSGSVSPLPSVQFFILQYGRRFSMIFSNTSQKGCNSPPTIWKNPRWNCWGRKLDETANSCLQFANKNRLYPWCWKTKQKAGVLGRISRRKIWKIMFPLVMGDASCLLFKTAARNLQMNVAGTITIGLRGFESSIPFESQTTNRQSNSPTDSLADTDLSQNSLHLGSFDDINVLSANGCLASKISEIGGEDLSHGTDVFHRLLQPPSTQHKPKINTHRVKKVF